MAHLSEGIYGTLSGAIGPVVCCVWKGKPYFRAYPAHFRDRKSEAQLAHRRKWQLCHKLVQQMLPLVRVGYAAFTENQTAYNACMSQCVRQATRVEGGVVEINFPKVVLGEGPLAVAQGVRVQQSGAALRLSWQSQADGGNASPADGLLLGVYNSRYEQACIFMNHAKRGDGMVQVSLPGHWEPTDVHCFMGFRNEKETLCSNIVYAGVMEPVEHLPRLDATELPQDGVAVDAPRLAMPVSAQNVSVAAVEERLANMIFDDSAHPALRVLCSGVNRSSGVLWQGYKDGLRRGTVP